MEPSVIGEAYSAAGGCSIGGLMTGTTIEIHRWGMYFSPMSTYSDPCPEEIVFVYTKSDRPAVIYYRPFRSAKFFATTHPKLFQKYQGDRYVKFPCHKIAVQKVHVWKNRAWFMSLVKKSMSGLEYIRSHDCLSPESGGDPNRKFGWTQLRRRIAYDRITTAGITFLHNLAYRNFFCV